ncbi:MAG: hypothetical protein JKX94_05840 [Sneathiella sp.]|nr:hypothetical protein [Sneathiella sp.]
MDVQNWAINYVLKNEKGLIDHPSDPGGITNYGISIRHAISVGDLDNDNLIDFDFDLDGEVTANDIRSMPKYVAEKYYHYLFNKWRIDEIHDPNLAVKVFDLCFPFGFYGGSLVTQRALRACGLSIVEDGILGTKSISAINSIYNSAALLAALCSEAAGRFRFLRNPAMEKGWLKRAYEFPHMEH